MGGVSPINLSPSPGRRGRGRGEGEADEEERGTKEGGASFGAISLLFNEA